ncbi:hypothetical protein [Veillonella parvula]|uniref:hypothetical protein n=1 Tax=Veillonella parvula TaxID=29466 RepID=UPI0015FF4720|nr:hypothetical protein [Veillonella parvula]
MMSERKPIQLINEDTGELVNSPDKLFISESSLDGISPDDFEMDAEDEEYGIE